jgi:hypothetical protein
VRCALSGNSGRCNDGEVNWRGVILFVMGIAFSFVAWRWFVAYNQSVYKMFHNRRMEPDSIRYKIVQVGRWLCVALGGLFTVGGAIVLVGGH